MKISIGGGLYREIGQAIYRLRTARKPRMSQEMLAGAAGVSRASIANIERGHHRVQLHILYDIAVALEVEPHDLLPHLNRDQAASKLPADVTKELNPNEQLAVGRMLRDRSEGGVNERP